MAVHRFKARIGLAIIGLALGGLPASAEKLRVAVAQPGFWNSSFIDFAQQEGFFAREGLEIEPFYTEGGASTGLQLDVIRGAAILHLDRFGAVEFVTSGPDRYRVFSCIDLGRRECILAFIVSDDGNADVGSILLRGDDDALHGALLVGGDSTAERGKLLS